MPVQAQDALARAAELVEQALAAGRPALDEAASKEVLAAYGVPVPRAAWCAPPRRPPTSQPPSACPSS